MRCGQPILPQNDKNIDICPDKPGPDKSPSAYHAPVGEVVTCPTFWHNVNNQFKNYDARMDTAAGTLIHEIFHWLSIDGKYVVDYHADGAGGHPDKHYYGVENSTYLAENKRSWAIRNNDNYRYFIVNVGRFEPIFDSVTIHDEGAGTGGFFVDLTWDELIKWKDDLQDKQYLADVETYVKDGKRLYTAVWRMGTGNGALLVNNGSTFSRKWNELKSTQDLIDIEVYKSGNKLKYLGVYRKKQQPTGNGGLLLGITWDDLVNNWREYAGGAYLRDIETYIKNGKRKYVGVWQAGSGNGALFNTKNLTEFRNIKRRLNPSQQLIDFERYLTGDGKWNYLGVWRNGRDSGRIYRYQKWNELKNQWSNYQPEFDLIDIEVFLALPARVP